PAPLIARAARPVQHAAARGTVLGAFSDVTLDSCHVSLRPGEAIVLYSDGLLDVRLDGERVDQRRLAQMLTGAPVTSATALLEIITNNLQRVDEELRDDLAVMALSRLSSS
ncbi:MAG: serine/threonine-protein phosphatase, partial [Actinobacteria bacterium]|nr:serine/threonine-protein phosphatase [Actinomycetota bacterium]